LSADWIFKVRGNLGERNQNEEPRREPGMRNRQSRPSNDFVAVKYDIDIEGARTFRCPSRAMMICFDTKAELEQIFRS
jgi:hypothetical protein